jgi:hypothetical protein
MSQIQQPDPERATKIAPETRSRFRLLTDLNRKDIRYFGECLFNPESGRAVMINLKFTQNKPPVMDKMQ